MYLLDTNIISELRLCAQGKCNVGVAHWAKHCNDNEFYTSVIVLMEIQQGIVGIQRKDTIQAQILQDWFDSIVTPTFEHKVFGIDEKTAHICATLPDHAPANDAWIASTAIQHDLILVTRNLANFDMKGLQTFNPFLD